MKKFYLRAFGCIVFFSSLTGALQAQTIYYVKQGGSGDGSSWANASGDFQGMINDAAAGDEVWVAAGDFPTPQNTSFSMKEGVKIFGGFPNTGSPAWNDRNWTTNITRLSGRLKSGSVPGDRVFTNNNNGLTAAAVLDGFTLSNGYIPAPNHGGGMYNNNVSPTIQNCTFSNNYAGKEGGAIYNLNAHPTITNCTFSNNKAGEEDYGKGGAIANFYSNPTVSNCLFTDNKVGYGTLTNGGGGMYNGWSNPIVTNCKFTGNQGYTGGGIYNHESSPQFSNTYFSGNSCSYVGGGVYNSGDGSTPGYTNCSFTGNNAPNGGGASNAGYTLVSFNNCLFYGNESISNGGFGKGGGIYNEHSVCNITNCTIVGNTASLNGGAVSSEGLFKFIRDCLVIQNSVIQGNNTGIYMIDNRALIAYSLVQSFTPTGDRVTVSASNNVDGSTDPLFVNAANPIGTDGAWGTADDGLQLQDASPAINKGNNTAVPGGLTNDLAGANRIQGNTVDMGAYESAYPYCNEFSNVVYVDAAVSQTGRGNSWNNAVKTFTEALDLVNSCNNINTILVAQGTYYPASPAGRDATFLIPRRGNIKIYGGYPTGGGMRDLVANPTILSGDIGTPGNNGDNSYHVMVISNTDAGADSLIIDGFTFKNANADGSGTFTLNDHNLNRNTGGGLLVALTINPNIAIRNCRFESNRANQGGGIYVAGAAPHIINSWVQGNFSSDNGGGMSNYISATPTLINVIISGNQSSFGGAVFNDNSTPTFINATIADNYAFEAAGFFNRYSNTNVNFRNSIIYGNRRADGAPSNIFNNSSGSANFSYSLIENATGSWDPGFGTDNGNNLFADPQFVTRNNPTSTNTPNTSGNYQLQSGSTAIDAGSNTLFPAFIGTDIMNAARIQQTAIDLGAIESPFMNCNLSITTSQTNILCNGAATGAASVAVDGGVAPYSYNWSNGVQNDSIINLTAGNYSCTITDARGCSVSVTITITEPTPLTVQLLSQNNTFCSGSIGSAEVQASNGTGPYTYLWSNGSSSPGVNNLAAGNYSCAVTDANGCTVNFPVTITQQTISGNKIFVDGSVTTSADGSSWSSAFNNLSDAITIASACNQIDSILVAAGTYSPGGPVSGNQGRLSTFLLPPSGGLKIYGGYPAGGGVRDVAANKTILDGRSDLYHVMVIAGIVPTADSIVIDGFTIQNGVAMPATVAQYNGEAIAGDNGAGIYIHNTSASGGKIAIRNCHFLNNACDGKGAAIYIHQSSPYISQCRFTNNFTFLRGGAITNDNGASPVISQCEFSNNESTWGGGAICNMQNANARIEQSTFLANKSLVGEGGGAILNENADPLIINCRLSGNTTENTNGGGSIKLDGGGALYNINSNTTIVNSIFSGNQAEKCEGAGILNINNSSLTVINSTFYGNTGALFTNAVPSGDGNIHNRNSHLTITNSIVYGGYKGITLAGTSTASVNYCLVMGWSGGGTGNLHPDAQPMLVNPTISYPYTGGDFHLRPCSPAINAGTTDTTGFNLPLYDREGLPRIQLGRVDLGAYEANSSLNESAGAIAGTDIGTVAYQWVDSTTWYSPDCNTLIASVKSNGSHPISGNTYAGVNIDASLLPGFVSRMYEIRPYNDQAIATGTITLYYTQAEFDEYNVANEDLRFPLPHKEDVNLNDHIANIRIRKVSGGIESTIIPHTVIWKETAQRWEITFDVAGFSNFYVFTELDASLPLHLISFAATEKNCVAHISWTTADEVNVSHFELEQSTDGGSWSVATQVAARNTAGENKYDASVNIAAATTFYRLKMVDRDGTTTYSNIARLVASLNCSDQLIKLYPNPVKDILYIEKAQLNDVFIIYDNAGRKIMQSTISKVIQDIDVQRLAAGIYSIVIVKPSGAMKSFKFIKKA